MSKLSDKITANPSFLSQYSQGMDALFSSGIFEILREIGSIQGLALDKHKSAIAAAYRSQGYNQAIDDLINFKERFALQKEHPKLPIADFGGVALALQNNHITQSEANEYRKSRAK